MKPEFISYPHISSYPVFLLLGFFFSFLLARRRATAAGFEGRHVDNLVLLFLVLGPAGGRLFSRLFYMQHEHFWEAFYLWRGGGLVFYGGFILCATTAIIYGMVMRVNLLKFLDVFAPSVALGLAFGRIGCFMAGCCWGDVCLDHEVLAKSGAQPLKVYQVQTFPSLSPSAFPLGVTFPKKSDIYKQHDKLGLITEARARSLPVHPVQLYEAAGAFLLCFLLVLASARKHKVGDISLALLWGYAFLRFWMEFFRADNSPVYWGMTFSQVTSLGIGAVCLCYMAVRGWNIASQVPTPRPKQAVTV